MKEEELPLREDTAPEEEKAKVQEIPDQPSGGSKLS